MVGGAEVGKIKGCGMVDWQGSRCGLALMCLLCLTVGVPVHAQRLTGDMRMALQTRADPGANFERRVAEIPMRDGVRLHTVILIPTGAQKAPVLLTRTPYNADNMTNQGSSRDLAMALDGFDNMPDVITQGAYIRVVQDVRGKFGSQGTFEFYRQLAGTALNPTTVDESTDAYDTIAWLVAHLPESNGRVGIIGTSYDGFTTLMATINPHPALRVAVPINPAVDDWRGDDRFHNGAFRQIELPYLWRNIATRDSSSTLPQNDADLYSSYLEAGSAGAVADANNMDRIGYWRKILEHPAYDSYWQARAVDRQLGARPLTVPVMLVHALWDQEDIYGALAVYRALKPKDDANDRVFLTIGPWSHGQVLSDGSRLGALDWGQDTARWWRQNVLSPFLAHYLKDLPMDVAPVTAFQTGSNQWLRLAKWPAGDTRPLYLGSDRTLAFEPTAGPTKTEDYVSDPSRPVPYVARPVPGIVYEGERWTAWLTEDQRNAAARPDVLTFISPPLTKPITVAGAPVARLTASTSGTDSDWIVKLIDAYPGQVAGSHAMGGYQLPVSMDIFRGRYRERLDLGRPLQANRLLNYEFPLPAVNHVFRAGHRLVVQIQSSWFPLYDRNPQNYVPSIFLAKPGDFAAATQKVAVSGAGQSSILLPIVPDD